jgi:polyphosphate glucokinase
MELGHLPYKKGTYEDYVGLRGLEKYGKKKWRKHVAEVVALLIAALEPNDVVLGGGNVKKLKHLPKHCRAGNNANAFIGGFRLWAGAGSARMATEHKRRSLRDHPAKDAPPAARTAVDSEPTRAEAPASRMD